MIERNLSETDGQQLHAQEAEILKQYQKAAEGYLPAFAEKGCTLDISLQWSNSRKKIWSLTPLPLENQYECAVCGVLRKDGKEVRIPGEDGEADYYPLGRSWVISDVSRKWAKLRVVVWPEVDSDFSQDMACFLEQLEKKPFYASDDF